MSPRTEIRQPPREIWRMQPQFTFWMSGALIKGMSSSIVQTSLFAAAHVAALRICNMARHDSEVGDSDLGFGGSWS
jgi:hypothetical protein